MTRFYRSALCGALLSLGLTAPVHSADLMTFWDTPQKGGNSFNGAPPDAGYFQALAETGAKWVRLTFTKWKGDGSHFLMGSADDYAGLMARDLAVLRQALDDAHAAGLKVVVAPLALPGARFAQLSQGEERDMRLWTDAAFQEQAVQFWTDLADALKDHPAVAGYNILNEPTPEYGTDLSENATVDTLRAWQKDQAGSLRDLPSFYERVIAAIRTVDPVTPVMVDGGWYANARSLAAWPSALMDDRVLYAFHMYEPYMATSGPNMKRDEPLRYPGVETPHGDAMQVWDRASVAAHVALPYEWAKAQGLPATRVVTGEFGCMRLWADCGTYLTDVMDAMDAQGGHWAFYSFREDVWDGMDYELPASLKPGRFYYLTGEGKADDLPRDGQLMDLLRDRMKK